MHSLAGLRQPCLARHSAPRDAAPVPLHPVFHSNYHSCHSPVAVASSSRGSAAPPIAARPTHHVQPSQGAAAVQRSSGAATERPLDQPTAGFDSIQDALQDLAQGKVVVVLDDEDRENEGDLIMAADKATTETMAFFVEHTSGVICISMQGSDLDRLKLPLMVRSAENEESMYTAFTVTVDLREGTSTGISASDRAKTIRAMADPASRPEQFIRPGHIFPLRARRHGVLVRPGHTEAAVDLSRLAGCYPAGVLCEIVDRRDGSMARTPQLLEFARAQKLKCITIADLIRYRLMHDPLVAHTAHSTVRTAHGDVTAHVFESTLDGSEHIALVVGGGSKGGGGGEQQQATTVCVQEESAVAAALGMAPLEPSIKAAAAAGGGVVVLLRNQSRFGKQPLAEECRRLGGGGGVGGDASRNGSNGAAAHSGNGGAQNPNHAARNAGLVDPREAEYAHVAQILRHIGVGRVRLVGGQDFAAQASLLSRCGVAVVDVAPLQC